MSSVAPPRPGRFVAVPPPARRPSGPPPLAAHRLRVTLHDFGLRQDPIVAVVVYLVAAAGTVMTLISLLRI